MWRRGHVYTSPASWKQVEKRHTKKYPTEPGRGVGCVCVGGGPRRAGCSVDMERSKHGHRLQINTFSNTVKHLNFWPHSDDRGLRPTAAQWTPSRGPRMIVIMNKNALTLEFHRQTLSWNRPQTSQVFMEFLSYSSDWRAACYLRHPSIGV